MHVLIIGGTRFIGPATARRLVAGGARVTVFHRGQTQCAALPAEVARIHGRRADLGRVVADLATAPDVVLDMIALGEADACTAVSALSSRVSRAVVISSVDVYRAYDRLCCKEPAGESTPLVETAPLRRSRYPRRALASGVDDWRHDYDKVLVERAYLAAPAGLDVTVLRLPFVYGPGDYRRRVAAVLEAMAGKEEITLSPDHAAWRCTRAQVENVAAAITTVLLEGAATRSAAPAIYNVGELQASSELEWQRRIARAAAWQGRVAVSDELAVSPAFNWSQHLVVDTGSLRRTFGFQEPLALDEALAATVRAASSSAGVGSSSSNSSRP